MKLLVALLVLAATIIFYKVSNAPSPAPQVVDVPAPPPAPTATPAPLHLAPEGMFFVTQYVSVQTPSGVAGFEPGRIVKLVSADEAKGTLTVSDGEYQIELTPEQLTNDFDVAAIAQRQDQASQQRLAAILEEDRLAYEAARLQINIEHAKDVARINWPPP